MLHLLGFDHEISEEAEEEMEEEEEFLLKSLGWKGKGLIQSAYDAEINANLHVENSNGMIPFNLFIINGTIKCYFLLYKAYFPFVCACADAL